MFVVPWTYDGLMLLAQLGPPFFLTDLTVSASPDLVSIIHGLQEVQQHTQRRLPLLVDENIHYRVLKLVYSISYARYNVPLSLHVPR